MNDKTRNPNPGMPGHDDDAGRTDKHARPGENDDRNRPGRQDERQPGQGTTPGQNPSTQRDD